MQPNSEPTQSDVSAVAQAMGIPDTVPEATQPQAPAQQPAQQQPAPQAQPTEPAQQQPQAPTPQPAPSQQQAAQPQAQPQDPFTQFAVTEQPSEPTAQTQPQQQPTEPTSQQTTPQPQQPGETQPAPTQQPQTQAQPQAQPQPQPEQTAPQTQSFDDYMNSILADLPEAPGMPDPSKVNPEDEESITNFFNDMFTAAEQRFEANYARKQAIQNSERKLWDDAFDKYGSLRDNKQLRDMVHAIRRSEFDKGVAITPTQAADRLLDALKGQYNKGVADNQVQTTIEQVQPQGGGSTQNVPTTLDSQNVLTAVQTGGEQALTDYLNSEIQAGRL